MLKIHSLNVTFFLTLWYIQYFDGCSEALPQFDIFICATCGELPVRHHTHVTTSLLRHHPEGVTMFCFITIHY